jgi:hypothetical protein
LIGWSGDKTRTLFAEIGPTKSATEVDLRAGHQSDIPLGAWSASARHTMPDGKALRRAVAASSTQWRSGASVDLDHHDNGCDQELGRSRRFSPIAPSRDLP